MTGGGGGGGGGDSDIDIDSDSGSGSGKDNGPVSVFGGNLSPNPTLSSTNLLSRAWIHPPLRTSSSKQPSVIHLNTELIESCGIDPKTCVSQYGGYILAGFVTEPSIQAYTVAYSGYKHGKFEPVMGGGRSVYVGSCESKDPNITFDIVLKGTGRTLFTPPGYDGFCPLTSAVKETLYSEYLFNVGIPTTRNFSCSMTGTHVLRDGVRTPCGVYVRASQCLVRVGTFQYVSGFGKKADMLKLVNLVIQRAYPSAHTTLDLIQQFAQRSAELVAKWMCAGFVHGSLTTDKVSLSGETLHAGSSAFLNTWDQQTHNFNIDDLDGRYSYKNQPTAMHDNVLLFVNAVQSSGIALPADILSKVSAQFWKRYDTAWVVGMRLKLGLRATATAHDELITDLLRLMAQQKLEFHKTFWNLATSQSFGISGSRKNRRKATKSSELQRKQRDKWLQRWRAAKPVFSSNQNVSPWFVLRNHVVANVFSEVAKMKMSLFSIVKTLCKTPYKKAAKHLEKYNASPPKKSTVDSTTTYPGI